MYVQARSFCKVISRNFTCKDNYLPLLSVNIKSEEINNTKQYWMHKLIAHAIFLQCIHHFWLQMLF